MSGLQMRSLLVLASLLLLSSCATRPINPPITQTDPSTGYRSTRQARDRNKDNLVILAFSGGGTRAAAFSYGVLEFLRRTEVVGPQGNKVRLLDAVDVITGVSGGSFTALAYGLYGDKLFDDYEQRFLKRDVQGEIVARTLSPSNWGKLGSTAGAGPNWRPSCTTKSCSTVPHLAISTAARALSLHFQPQIDVRSGEIRGLEALLRWHSPQLGEVPPADFIPIAEETGLILPIGEWVTQTACRQLRKLQSDGLPIPRVAVNVSASQFKDKGFSRQIARILAESGLDPECLELELTESILMSHAEESVRMLYDLKSLGVQLAVDDFGTGYSSLSYLKRFPIDRLKIDKSFVHNIDKERDNAAIAQAVIAMAKTMSLKVTAEGVETCEELRFLDAHSCGEVQGFLFSKPVPVEQVPALIARLAKAPDGAITRKRSDRSQA